MVKMLQTQNLSSLINVSSKSSVISLVSCPSAAVTKDMEHSVSYRNNTINIYSSVCFCGGQRWKENSTYSPLFQYCISITYFLLYVLVSDLILYLLSIFYFQFVQWTRPLRIVSVFFDLFPGNCCSLIPDSVLFVWYSLYRSVWVLVLLNACLLNLR